MGVSAAAQTDAPTVKRFSIETEPRGYTAKAEIDTTTPLSVRIIVELHAAYPQERFRQAERWWSDAELPEGAGATVELTVPEPEVGRICEQFGRCRLAASVRTFRGGVADDRASDRLKVKVGPEHYAGRPLMVPGWSRKVGDGRSYKYGIYIEGGVRIDGEGFARQVERILSSRRGWTDSGAVSFRRVADRSEANTRIILASGALVDRLCFPLDTDGRVSCRNGDDVVLNLDRWRRGSGDFATTIAYRQYLVNHEVGHRIGQFHRYCSRAGARAAVMQQQTGGSTPCRPGSWPLAAELVDASSGPKPRTGAPQR